jgi:YVTN family beta-propeller protein
MTLRAFAVLVILVAAFSARAAGDLNHPTGVDGLLLIDKLGGHVRFFDPSTFKERSAVKVPANPHDFALSPDGRLAYVPIYGDGVYGKNPNKGHEVYIFDLAARTVAGVIDIAPYRAPHAVQIDRQGTLYVASDEDRKLLVIDPRTRTITAAIDTEGTGHWIAMLPDGSKMYVANKNDKRYVTVIDLKTRAIVARVPVANGTQGIAASPDGTQVVAMDFSEPRMHVIDPRTDTVIDQIVLKDNTGGAYKAYYSPDGKRLLTMSLGGKVNVLDPANLRGEQTVLTAGRAPMGFAFSADGKTALVANHGDGSVSVIDLTRNQIAGEFHGGTGIETLTYY